MPVISLSNQKGGVAKTTTAVNLSASLALMDFRVLLIDMDPQCNATVSSGVAMASVCNSLYEVLTNQSSLHEAIQTVEHGYDVLPSSHQLTAAEVQMLNSEKREYTLNKLLSEQAQDYDFVLIDCPPALNLLTVNALVASDGVLIPVQCEYLALEGLTKLLKTLRALEDGLGCAIDIYGLVRTMYDGRNLLSRQVSHQLKRGFGDRLFESIIPRNVRLAEAPSHGVPITAYDKRSQGAAAYLALAAELVQKTSVKPNLQLEETCYE